MHTLWPIHTDILLLNNVTVMLYSDSASNGLGACSRECLQWNVASRDTENNKISVVGWASGFDDKKGNDP